MHSIPLVFKWPAGQATFHLSQDEALKLAVILRRLGLGLSYSKGQPLVTRATDKFSVVEAAIRKMRASQKRYH